MAQIFLYWTRTKYIIKRIKQVHSEVKFRPYIGYGHEYVPVPGGEQRSLSSLVSKGWNPLERDHVLSWRHSCSKCGQECGQRWHMWRWGAGVAWWGDKLPSEFVMLLPWHLKSVLPNPLLQDTQTAHIFAPSHLPQTWTVCGSRGTRLGNTALNKLLSFDQ